MIIIRVQSENGTKRIEAIPSESTKSLYEKVHSAFNLSDYNFVLYKSRNRKDEISSNGRRTLKGSKLNHGDMIFMVQLKKSLNEENLNNGSVSEEMEVVSEPSTSSSFDNSSTNEKVKEKVMVTEHEVDKILAKTEGRVERKRNEQLCGHKGNSKCIHCSSLDPWDEAVIKDFNIKHLSFHAYLRKLKTGISGKFLSLEDINCKIKSGCKEHPPWPQGICSKCQPSAVTLNRQTFRHVDNVTFENPQIVERFLEYWKTTGHQRIGFLYGKYLSHLDVPLGIKASVAAIYEPPQEGSRDHVHLLPDPKEDIVNEVAKGLGLECVGWVFTDLVSLDASKGTVRYTRHADTYFLTSHEIIMAGYLQNKFPNPCKFSSSGFYGSKYTTVIVTGGENNQVHMEGYQVSNQCQSLVRDEILIPTKDEPALAYIKESSAEQYVPDVYFKEKDQYNNEVVKLGRPLPVEYFLIDNPVSTPNEPIYTFAHRSQAFPVENRLLESHLQDFGALASYLTGVSDSDFLAIVSDFHLLVFLASMDMFQLRLIMSPLLEAVKTKDSSAAIQWKNLEDWSTVEQLILAYEPSIITDSGNPIVASGFNAAPAGAEGGSSDTWTCNHCTFINQLVSENCDMCHLPK